MSGGQLHANGCCWGIHYAKKMIHAVLVLNTLGKPRLAKFYYPLRAEKQQDIIRSVYKVLSSRAEHVCNFVEAEIIFGYETKLVYKHFATLYFIFVIDNAESELGVLDLIQVFVESLDRCFKNVCELDIVYNFNKVHTILDEMIIGGQVVETNPLEVIKTAEEVFKQESFADMIAIALKSSGKR
ncbi:hypothetical protein GOP47_0002815 [Adiantum capillus-veneris]|uniref:AP complex mu/sigma subunit domain-containing protein n=1 Tax=Adiantum capillus-veneris TaxID=13818 RepID=A0A9D4VBC4_ADICA|nr:hypothetical protein GOP47_0002815 [Adiantum capillus-veneris]